mmetsp:Transcript_11743/g.17787  ORF Transcript_11743/g.17787 Transcript_11743/m.17787 type:complete len:315 (-) Transcript_11743:31-975(-)
MSFERVCYIETDCDGQNVRLAVAIAGECSDSGLCLLFIHGAGSSKHTWHNQVSCLRGHVLCIAPDMRSHGESSTELNMSISALTDDIVHIVSALGDIIGSRQIVVIGHSVGGSIAVRSAHHDQLKDKIIAVIVVDLVEDTAMESLENMRSALESWPKRFQSIQDCVNWSTGMRRPQSRQSAEISIPPTLLATDDNYFVWRINLLLYENEWKNWFKGFNSAFLGLCQHHCLILSSADRLDRTMCTAHMQGLFELHVVQGGMAGHFVHEDCREETTGIIVNFLQSRGLLDQKKVSSIMTVLFSTAAVLNRPTLSTI